VSGNHVALIDERPMIDPADLRKAARILIAVGLDQQPGDPWGVAHDIAQALGLIPTIPAHPRKVSLTDDRPARRRT
jgi:hypothetical protein